MSGLDLRVTADGVRVPIRVAPRASRDAIVGVHDGALKVALTAPPVEGAANDALVRLLAKALGVPKGAVRLVQGERSRDKVVEIAGVDEATVHAWIAGG
ncbi:MAG: DUF167 domain-containing protein [Myxococcota bacterium]|jgi:hypothetical protein|nr:DUF167 domain-containing protein [Myxococcota bacterium]